MKIIEKLFFAIRIEENVLFYQLVVCRLPFNDEKYTKRGRYESE